MSDSNTDDQESIKTETLDHNTNGDFIESLDDKIKGKERNMIV